MSELSCLVIEDEPGIGWAIRRLLEQTGARVIVAVNGASALEHLATETVSVILLDVKLPDADGFELAGVINQMAPAIPIVIISAYFYPNDPKVRQMLDRGVARRFIAKPFRHEELLCAVRDLLAPKAPPLGGAQRSIQVWSANHSSQSTGCRIGPRTAAKHQQNPLTRPQ
ncbi:MAG TPA: response regulator [Candidatus Binataceae bacterium]|jgi:CheY-like chemotaxis protein|nr:response regulator [Candidatus Binataceae bacterium]